MTTGGMRASGERVPMEGWPPIECLVVRLSFNRLVLVTEHRFHAWSEPLWMFTELVRGGGDRSSRQVRGRRALHDLGSPCLPGLWGAVEPTERRPPVLS